MAEGASTAEEAVAEGASRAADEAVVEGAFTMAEEALAEGAPTADEAVVMVISRADVLTALALNLVFVVLVLALALSVIVLTLASPKQPCRNHCSAAGNSPSSFLSGR